MIWYAVTVKVNLNTKSGIIYATADEAETYMFYRCFFLSFFLFFFRPSKIPDNRSRERLNGFS